MTASTLRPKVWLAYVSYPVTTAVYFERALRKFCDVTTVGPKIDQEILASWNLSNMKLEVRDHDIPTQWEPDVVELYQKTPEAERPDVFIWMESVYGYFPKNISQLKCAKACLMIDSHLNLSWHLPWASQFDQVFVVHRDYVPHFLKAGCRRSHWMPVACDPEIHTAPSNDKTYDLGFVGSLPPVEALNNPQQPGYRRAKILNSLKSQFKLHVERCFWKEMSAVFGRSKIVFNCAVREDLNMRVFEALCSGSMLLTDSQKQSGLEELFKSGEDLVTYTDESVVGMTDWYLRDEVVREEIARRGRERVLAAHTYDHRAKAMMAVILGEEVTTPDAHEWRALSEGRDPFTFTIKPPRSSRSFVIPVLDLAPASQYNILTLLDNLKEIPGQVIVVFNSAEMAQKLAGHPRIDLSATLSQNVGVARAWNIGLHMSETESTFVMNSDLFVKPKAVEIVERALQKLDSAAVVGPQGSFFDFYNSSDYFYFDKGMSRKPTQVDAVSGFFFAVKTRYFHDGTLAFEDTYTPCYFEEWDLGLQCRLAGLKEYVVPTVDYDHIWSGTIRAHRIVKFFDRAEDILDIHARNARLFHKKWLEISRQISKGDAVSGRWRGLGVEEGKRLLLSGWPEYLERMASELDSVGNKAEADKLRYDIQRIRECYSRSFGKDF